MSKHTLGHLAIMTSTLVVGGLLLAADTGPVGDWEGKLDTGNGTLRVVVHISQAEGGKLSGTLDSPDQGAAGIAMSSVTYRDPDLHLEIESIGGSFDGKMSKDNCETAGEWKQGGGSAPLTFKRKGCAAK